MWMVPQAHSLVLIPFPEMLGAVHLYDWDSWYWSSASEGVLCQCQAFLTLRSVKRTVSSISKASWCPGGPGSVWKQSPRLRLIAPSKLPFGLNFGQKEINKTQCALSQPYLPHWYSSKFHHRLIIVSLQLLVISACLWRLPLELPLFHISWAFCVSYLSISSPDRAPHVCVLGFLAKGHSDWCFPCSLRADQETACSVLWSVTAVSLQAQWDQTSQCGVAQYHVSGLLSPLNLLWIAPFLFEGGGYVLCTNSLLSFRCFWENSSVCPVQMARLVDI